MPYEKLNSPTRVKKLSVSWKSKRVDWHHVSGGYFFLLYHFSPHLIRRPSHTEQILFIYACFIYFIPRALSVFSTELNCCLHFPLAFAGLVGGDCHKGWRWRGVWQRGRVSNCNNSEEVGGGSMPRYSTASFSTRGKCSMLAFSGGSFCRL